LEVPCSITKGEKQDFQNCTGSDPDTRWRRCCTSNLLPYGCECFDTSSESYFNHKLFKLPECPDDIPVEFTIYNNREFLEGVPITASALQDHHEHTTLKTLFLVHGYTDSADITWMNALRKELLMMYDFNVVLVDWEIGAKYPYRQAVANIRTVAAMMGQLISKMAAQWDLRLDDVHLIGHSLGAHVMGLTGQEVLRLTGKRVGRISGLDPAGPGFWTAADLVILDKTDASFVDVIHTNGRKLGEGMARSIGHADFWPNGGASQPGCGSMDNSCSHHRAHDLYQASVLGLCEFHAVNEQRAVCMMGYHANATCSGVFDAAEFTTQTYFPFC